MASQLSTPDTDSTSNRHLSGDVCLVTGSSRGIGRAVATTLGRHGAAVAVNYRSSADEAAAVVDDVTDAGGDAVAVQADVADPDAVERMRDRIHDEFGPVDVLVNNAGVTIDRTFDEMTHEEWRRVVDVNLNGAFNCTKAFFEDVRDAEAGRVVNVSSVVGKQGNYGQANYAAAKSGLFGFTRSLAHELAPHGATANCVAPGYTRTDMVEDVREDIRERMRQKTLLGRFASVEDVAAVVRFLASDDSAYVTGEVVDVNGGIDL
ncbi:MAG: beta-ketoacyl-ACP reductase [Haloferacaceae archaeon]